MSDGSLTRRRFLGTGAAVGAGGLLGAVPASGAAKKKQPKAKKPVTPKKRTADVIVVGGGFAGLTAARAIAAAGKSVFVVEARDRVGGRVWNHDLGGGQVSERGGTFVGPTQDRVLALMDDLKIGKFDTYDTGQNVYIDQGNRQTFSDTSPTGSAPLDPTLLPDLATLITRLDQMAAEVGVDAPWKAAKAADYDSQTLDTWIRANQVNPAFARLATTACRPIFGAESREISLLFTLFYIASSGNEKNPGTFERNFNTRAGGQMWRVDGGSQTIAFKIAADVLKNRIFLSRPVRRIAQGGGRVRVECDGLTLHGRQAIVAVPPALAGRIDYTPILDFQRDQLTQRYGMGALTKVAAVYDKPFWRDKGLTGQVLNTDGLVSATFDDTPPSGGPGIVFGFVGGDRCREYALLSEADRKDRVTKELAAAFGDEALKPTEFFDTTWANEQWTRGCPVGIAGPGLLLAYGDQIRKPQGRIHWAGTETSTYWNGYMDGAVRSGERAAAEALADL